MKRQIFLVSLFVLLLLLNVAFVVPALAQDITPAATPTVAAVATVAPVEAQPPVVVTVETPAVPAETPLYSPTDIILLAVIVLLAVLVGLREVQLREYIRLAFASVPPEGRQFAYDLTSRLAQEVSTLVAGTPNTIDDAAWENELKPRIMALMQEVLRPPVPPPPPGGSLQG